METNDLTELDVVAVAPGQKAVIVPDALPDLERAGMVDSVGDIFEEKQGDITYTVRIALEDGDPRLRWGLTVNVTFLK